MAEPLPIIICGRQAEVATTVTTILSPDYEVIRQIFSVDQGKAELPELLRRQPPPVAIVTGGGYNDNDVATLKEVCGDGGKNVVWLDHTREEGRQRPQSSEEFVRYGEKIAERVKKTLGEALNSGEKGGMWRY